VGPPPSPLPWEHFETIEVSCQLGMKWRENGMPNYEVEEMFAEKVIAAHKIMAPTPFRAAKLATNRDITLRASEIRWIRVFEEDRRHRTYEYAFVKRPQFQARASHGV
jgi:hypothetical protein